jgi:hypothetical protein
LDKIGGSYANQGIIAYSYTWRFAAGTYSSLFYKALLGE